MKNNLNARKVEVRPMENNVTKYLKIVGLTIVGCIALAMSCQVFETVDKGSYQIKQAAVTGSMSAKMTPGLWMQMFGDIQVWPKAETFYFTADSEEGGAGDASVEVRFADGSVSHISGTLRVQMPATEGEALELVTKLGFKSYTDLEQKLILPVVRNSLTLTANMMTARESYAERRNDYVYWAWDQIQNGIYETVEEQREIQEGGEKVMKTFKAIKRDEKGSPLYQRNPLAHTGIILANFEIKKIVYPETVEKQISTQQSAYMAVATAKAEAQKQDQEKLRAEAEGKANVAKSQYEMEQLKIKEVVRSQQRLEVAKNDKLAAEFKKQKDILEGEGEAEKRKLIMSADGALTQKLDAWKEVNKVYAEQFAKQKWVPEVMMGSNATGGNSAQNLIDLLMTKTAKDLSLDMTNKTK